MRPSCILGLVALAAASWLVGCSSNSAGGDATGTDAGTTACATPITTAEGEAGASCATCLESGCFSQLAAQHAATPATCAAATSSLASCAQTTCAPACGEAVGLAALDGGASFSAACEAYVACCVAANSATLLDAGITLASIELSCDQNASLSTDPECATLTAEFLDAGVACN